MRIFGLNAIYCDATELFLFVNNRLQYVAADRSARHVFQGSFVDLDETLSGKRGEKFGPVNEIISLAEISVGGKKFLLDGSISRRKIVVQINSLVKFDRIFKLLYR